MASVYTNDLRLEEIGSGEQSGTWGDTTNTNLELISEALSYDTEAITTNADTHTSTVADGAADAARAMYIKYTGTLDSTCTITIAPNTISRVHLIENATSGSQNIIISQGSGANVTIPPGDTKAVYLDGAGSGAAVTDAFASLSVVDLKVQDDLTVTDDATIGGDLTVNGDTITFTSANSSDPIVKLINTTNDTSGAELHIRKDKGAAGADGDIVGLISFIGDDATQVQHIFAKMEASIATAADGSEGGKLILGVATHDAEFQNGLVLQDGNAEDEIDVTIASGSSSVTTVTGVLISNNNFEVKTGGPSTYDGITDDGAGIVVGSSSASVAGLVIRTGTSGVGSIYFADNSGSADARKAGFIEFQHATDDMIIQAEDDLRLYAKEDVVMRGTTYTFDSEGGASEFMKIDTDGNLGLGMTPDTGVKLSVNGAVGPTNGSNSAPTHTFYSDPDTGMYRSAANTIGFAAGGTEYVQIGSFGVAADTLTNKTSSGSITIDSANDLVINADGGNMVFQDGSVNVGELANYHDGSSHTSDFVVAALTSDKDILFRGLDSSTTITALKLDISDLGKALFNSGLSITANDMPNVAAASIYQDSSNRLRITGGTAGYLFMDDGNSTVQMFLDSSGDLRVGGGNSRTPFIQGGTNDGRVEGSPGYSFMDDPNTGMFSPADDTIAFSTGGTERLRIASGAEVTAFMTSGNSYILNDGTPSSGNAKFYVNANGGIYNYQSNNVNLSDEREKKNISSLSSKWDAVKKWSLKEFHFNSDADSDSKRVGVIAQDIESDHPDLVTEFDLSETIKRKAVKEHQITWMAIKALQEAMTRIETLEAKVTALEGS
jgi:hypothetical protein